MIGEKKFGKKIIAIFVVLLFFAVPFSIAEADEIVVKEQENDLLSIELSTVNSDGIYRTEIFEISEKDLEEIQYLMSILMEQIEINQDLENIDVENLKEKLSIEDSSILGTILGMFSSLRHFRNKGFILSSGHGRDFSLLRKINFKFKKRIGFWLYNSNKLTEDNTIIAKPLALDFKILKGRQIGFMTGFKGFYLTTSQGFLKESYTMFIGSARLMNGIQLSPL